MAGYLIRRLIGALVVMFAVATLVFFMLRFLPGDPIATMLFELGDAEAVDRLRAKYGLDQPIYVQFWKWLGRVAVGDLGNSIYGSRIPVSRIIAESLPRTMSLASLSFFVALIIALPAGLVSALYKHTKLDHTVTVIAFLGLSMPDFWFAIVLILIFAGNLQWLPAIGYTPLSEGIWAWLRHLILPAIAIGTPFAAIIARMIRSSMLEVLQMEYIRVARSKGLLTPRLIMVHAFPNALIPVVTVTGIALGILLTGTVVVENVFAIKGLGRVLIQSILNRDFPVVQGSIFVISAIFIFANLLVDVLYTVIDPRIRYD